MFLVTGRGGLEEVPDPQSPRGTMAVQLAWTNLDHLYRENPTDPRIAGARAAAEWCVGIETVSPETREQKPATLRAVREESHKAAMVQLGIRSGDRDFSLGVSGWCFWWTGLEPLPGWLEPRQAA